MSGAVVAGKGKVGAGLQVEAEAGLEAEPDAELDVDIDVEVDDEDRLVVPEAWRQLVLPRRGAVDVQVRVPEHTGSTAALGRLYGTGIEAMATACLEDFRTLPQVVEPLRQQLSGDLTPLGTAVMSMLAAEDGGKDLLEFVDAWVAAYGLPFAAATAVEAMPLSVQRMMRTDAPSQYVIRGADDRGLPRELHVARAIRAYLAAAPDEVYAAAVRELDGHRRDLKQRVFVSYLMPTESAWTAEACAEAGKKRLASSTFRPLVKLLQCSVSRPEELAALRKRKAFHPNYVDETVLATATVALGTDVVDLLPEALDSRDATGDSLRMILDCAARIPCDAAFEMLTVRLTRKHFQAAVMEATERFPRRAIRLLARAACAQDANAELARNLLNGLLARKGELAEQVRPALSEDERALVDRLCLQAVGHPEASASALPAILVSPPWTRKRPRRATIGVPASADPHAPDGLVAPALSRVEWKPGEREAFERRRPRLFRPVDVQRTLDQIEKSGTSGSSDQDCFALLNAPDEDARRALPHLRGAIKSWEDPVDVFGAILVRFGTEAIGPALHAAQDSELTGRAPLLQPIVNLRVARLMADWLLRLKSVRTQARSWFERHGDDAATLLIPDALGLDKGLRKSADAALRYLAGLGVDVVGVAQHHYGAETALAVKQTVEVDPLDLVPGRPPKAPEWLRSATLPQILLRDRRTALPAESVQHVLTMLAISRPGEPYAGLEMVRKCVDPVSLAVFGRALLAAWRAVDYPNKESWILSAQSVLGDTETVRGLVPLIRAWPRDSAHKRAEAGLAVLGEFDSEYAHFQLHLIAQSSPRRALNRRAQDRVASLASKFGVPPERFVDRLMPDFGLDAEAGLWLDYGPRRFQVRCDELLRHTVFDESGAACPDGDLPVPAAADDAELAEVARARLSGLTEDIRALTDHVPRRMESGMVMGRSWTAEEFRDRLLRHPLLWRQLCGVVWLCEFDGAATAFRVAEDRGFADVHDDVFALPEQAEVRVAHPLHLGADLGAWAELFADYEILQPFAQLGRPVYPAEERSSGSAFTRFEGSDVRTEQVRALLERGWEGAHKDRWFEEHFVRATPDGRWLMLGLDSGVGLTEGDDDAPTRRLETVCVASARGEVEQDPAKRSESLQGIDAVTASELLADLHRLSEH
jgi:hypothetical protein